MKIPLAFYLFTCVLVYLFTASPALAQSPTGVIVGVVRNGTAGDNAASLRRLSVVVRALEPDGREGATFNAITNEAGEYRVEDVARAAGRRFVVTVEYQGILYRSDVLPFSAETRQLDLPLDIFETTETDDALRIERAHLLVFLSSTAQVFPLCSFASSAQTS